MGRFDYVPQAKYTELFINNNHKGTYLIGQKVEESKNRVNIGDNGYLIEIDTDAHGRIKKMMLSLDQTSGPITTARAFLI